MSLADIATLLQETGAELHRVERILAQHPDDFATLINMQSLQKRQRDLQERFEEMAIANKVEVLYYRAIPKTAEPPVRALNEVLSTFQHAFTVVFDSILTNTKKTRAYVSAAAAEGSSLGFAYAFPGSVGFALTLPKEMVLLDKKEHAEAIEAIQRLTKVRDSNDVKAFAESYGIASVRMIYKWVDAIAKNDLDSEVQWAAVPDKTTAPDFLVQVPDARAVRDIIANTSETRTEDRSLYGTLIAYDWKRRTFRFAVADKVNIHGTVSEKITEQLKVPEKYDIRVRAHVTNRFSTEEKEERFELLDIEQKH